MGANYRDVLALIYMEGLALAAIGIAAGLLGAMGMTRMIASLLFGVKPADPLTFATAPAILLAVAALACWVPARRAARVDPIQALRLE